MPKDHNIKKGWIGSAVDFVRNRFVNPMEEQKSSDFVQVDENTFVMKPLFFHININPVTQEATLIQNPPGMRLFLDDCCPIRNVNERDEQHRTALHFACLNRHKSAVLWLLKAGAATNLPDKKGNFPVDYLFFDEAKIKAIQDKDVGFKRMWRAAMGLKLEIDGDFSFAVEEHLFQPDFDPTGFLQILFPKEDPENVLTRMRFLNAVTTGDLATVKAYMEINGDEPEALNVCDQSRSTALINAVYFKQLDVVKELLQNPLVKRELTNNYGQSALNYACAIVGPENEEYIELLTTKDPLLALTLGIAPAARPNGSDVLYHLEENRLPTVFAGNQSVLFQPMPEATRPSSASVDIVGSVNNATNLAHRG